eukprot:NODE_5519_length_693_cov_55.342756_g5496_i0.p1 GENE.NODE_5519_length_693_cov_55.342756_g5496_i0~~NODE_5519_length_693_cov_55.342756_g5496_i0.p1  ORF type:complete len:190 (+),score=44.47 NODE_5519_length_693_cov_55.342756_g5496_i0:62-631(+)
MFSRVCTLSLLVSCCMALNATEIAPIPLSFSAKLEVGAAAKAAWGFRYELYNSDPNIGCLSLNNMSDPIAEGILFRNDQAYTLYNWFWGNSSCSKRTLPGVAGCFGQSFAMLPNATSEGKCDSNKGELFKVASPKGDVTMCVIPGKEWSIPTSLELYGSDGKVIEEFHFEDFKNMAPPASTFNPPAFCP